MYWLLLLSLGAVSAFALEDKCLCTNRDVIVREVPKHFAKPIGTVPSGSCMRMSEFERHGQWLKLQENGYVWSGMFQIGENCDGQEDFLIQKRGHSSHYCSNCHSCTCEQRNTDYCVDHCHHCMHHLNCPAENWSDWGDCSKSCGGGTQFRSCTANCGTTHHPEESRTCNNQTCPPSSTHPATHSTPVDGQWSHWRNASQCSAICGSGTYHLQRKCIYHDHHNRGKPCQGETSTTRPCTVQCKEYHCDKLRIFHEIAEQVTTNKTVCDNRRNTSSEEFVFDNCDVPRDPLVWKKGRVVYDLLHHNCTDIPLYTPVASFAAHANFSSDTRGGFAGVFVGCLDDHSGIKVATKLCDSIAEVLHVPSPRHSVFASNGIVPRHPNGFFTIAT